MTDIAESNIMDCKDGYTLLDLTKDSFTLGPSRSQNGVWTFDFLLVSQKEIFINGGRGAILSSYMNGRLDAFISGKTTIDYMLFDKQRLCGIYNIQAGFVLDPPYGLMLGKNLNPRQAADATKQWSLLKKPALFLAGALLVFMLSAELTKLGWDFLDAIAYYLAWTSLIVAFFSLVYWTKIGFSFRKLNKGELFSHKFSECLSNIEGRRLLANLRGAGEKVAKAVEKHAELKEKILISAEHEDLVFNAIQRGDAEWITNKLIPDLLTEKQSDMLMAFAMFDIPCMKALFENGLRCTPLGLACSQAKTSDNFPVIELFIKYIPEFDAGIDSVTRAKFDAWRESGRPVPTSDNAMAPGAA